MVSQRGRYKNSYVGIRYKRQKQVPGEAGLLYLVESTLALELKFRLLDISSGFGAYHR